MPKPGAVLFARPSGGDAMIVVTDDTTRPELEEAITSLRAKQRTTGLIEDRERIGRAIDELLDQMGELG